MAQKTVITLEDDIAGGEADETVTFALDGTSYEIDLNVDNADILRGILYDYTARARKVGGKAKSTGRKAVSSGPAAAEIRAWAIENGYDVPARGRIPTDVREAFDSCN